MLNLYFRKEKRINYEQDRPSEENFLLTVSKMTEVTDQDIPRKCDTRISSYSTIIENDTLPGFNLDALPFIDEEDDEGLDLTQR
jgi:hypothetical protein